VFRIPTPASATPSDSVPELLKKSAEKSAPGCLGVLKDIPNKLANDVPNGFNLRRRSMKKGNNIDDEI
jgi:hypothetical protein